MALQWSTADLSRQQALVARAALRAELSRLHLTVARRRFVATLRTTIGSPLVIGGVFAAGFLLARRGGPRRDGRSGVGVAFSRVRFAVLRGMALMQLYSRLASQFRAGWRSTEPQAPVPTPLPAADA